MNHRHTHANGICTCSIIPEYILEAIARNGTPAQRVLAQQSLAIDRQIRQQRTALALSQARARRGQGVGPPHKNRLIYTADNTTNLPGTLVRSEGEGPSGDIAVDEAYDGLGATFDLYYDVYERNSIDDNGMDLIGTVHYGNLYNNARWTGSQMLFGDGDPTIFNRFTIAIDIMGHELTHGVTGWTAGRNMSKSAIHLESNLHFWLRLQNGDTRILLLPNSGYEVLDANCTRTALGQSLG